MKTTQALSDKAAIGLSLLCTAHCLALPVILVMLPSLASTQLNSEAFHLSLVFAVLPISAFALTMGCRQHGRMWVALIGGAGLIALISALVLAETVLHHSPNREVVEKSLTIIGSFLIAYSHIQNYRLCQTDSTACCENTECEMSREA